jgi:hypothetical protein
MLKDAEYGHVFSIHAWIRNTGAGHFKKGEGKRENNGGYEPNQSTLYT